MHRVECRLHYARPLSLSDWLNKKWVAYRRGEEKRLDFQQRRELWERVPCGRFHQPDVLEEAGWGESER